MHNTTTFNVSKLSADAINELIKTGTDKGQVEALGYKWALPLLDEAETTLEIRYYGTVSKPCTPVSKQTIGLRSAAYCNAMNAFPA